MTSECPLVSCWNWFVSYGQNGLVELGERLGRSLLEIRLGIMAIIITENADMEICDPGALFSELWELRFSGGNRVTRKAYYSFFLCIEL